MKAARVTAFGGVETVVISDIPEPKVKPGQILVAVRAASFNPFDGFLRRGAMPTLATPYVAGGDFSGVTSEGKEVFGTAIVVSGGSGAFAQRAAVNEKNCAPKPANASFAEAAALPLVGSSSVQALEETIRVVPGMRVLIHGAAGGIGHIAVQLAKTMGAWVAATARTPDIAFVRSLGADDVVDFTREDFSKKWKDLDAVFDTVGGDVLAKSELVIKPGGTIVSMKGAPVHGVAQQTKQTAERLARVAELFDSGAFRVHVDKTFPLEEVRDAWQFQETGHPKGKVVMSIA